MKKLNLASSIISIIFGIISIVFILLYGYAFTIIAALINGLSKSNAINIPLFCGIYAIGIIFASLTILFGAKSIKKQTKKIIILNIIFPILLLPNYYLTNLIMGIIASVIVVIIIILKILALKKETI